MPPEVFYEKSVSYKFHNIHKKTPVLKSLLKKLYLKETPTQMFSCDYREISKNTYFEEVIV